MIGRLTTGRLLLLLLIATPAFAGRFDACPEFVAFGDPGGQGIPLCRTGYALLYDGEAKVPVWVVERLTKEHVSEKMDRTDDFRPDQEVPEDERAELSDYKGSGYDRGHMAPAADMRWSEKAMSESFLLTNMAPQVGTGMNRGIWADLEGKIRDWTKERGEVVVYTGPVLGSQDMTIGKHKVIVPPEFYKIVFDPLTLDAVAWEIPNEKQDEDVLPSRVVSIDQVEADTGLDFLSILRDDVENVIEATKSEMWQ